MRQSKPIANCQLRYTCEVYKDGTWQLVETGKQFQWVQVNTSANTKAAWEHAIWRKDTAKLRELAQALVDYWNSMQPAKWRYILEG